jgi:dihydropteroate synthase
MSQVSPTSSPSTAATARPTPEDQRREELDHALSQRFIALDPSGYFLIKIDGHRQELVAEHYGNAIDEQGLATDPETGEVIRCQGAAPRAPMAVYRGRTAKELGMLLTEEGASPISRLDHALYLGRELQKAEQCLACGEVYIQD